MKRLFVNAKNTLNWVGTDIIGTDTGFKVEEVDGKLQISSENNVLIDLNFSDWLNDLAIDGVKTKDGVVLVSCDKKESSDKDVYIVADSQGNEITKKEMGFCVSFYPLNNTTIEDIKNVVSGSAITEPAKPEREGYEFAGWYTSYDYNADTQWNFDEDKVTKNTSLWAKWVEVPTQTLEPAKTLEPTITTTKTITKPAKVKSVTVKNNSKKAVKISWKKVSKASGYEILYSTNKKFKNAAVMKVTASANSKTIKNLKKGKTYYFKVRAYKKSGKGKITGAYSTVKKVKIKK